MNMFEQLAKCAGLACIGFATTSSTAGVISLSSTFGFTDLSTSYDTSTGLYVAQSSMFTSGDVTDFNSVLPVSAEFNAGQIGNANSAFVEFSMNLNNITSSGADAINGQILIRDIDGDTLTGSFEGTWNLLGGFAFFDGIVESAGYDSLGNGIFESAGAGDSFANPAGTLNGAVSFLIQMPEWFDSTSDFADRVSSGDGVLLTPTPGSVSLLAIGGFAATRRRRS